jgi:hypothetical protein
MGNQLCTSSAETTLRVQAYEPACAPTLLRAGACSSASSAARLGWRSLPCFDFQKTLLQHCTLYDVCRRVFKRKQRGKIGMALTALLQTLQLNIKCCCL